MKHRRKPCLRGSLTLLLLLAAVESSAPGQAPGSAFYDVAITAEDIYSYNALKFKGDFLLLESPSGKLALGRTSEGVTVVIILDPGTLHLEAPEAVQEQFKTVFGGYPLDSRFNTVYLRLHPKEYDATFGKLEMTRVSDDAALKKAQEIFDQRFAMSYHAGPKAILPQQRTRVADIDLPEIGLVCLEEGYWLRVNRMSPFGKVYPRDFVNPKK